MHNNRIISIPLILVIIIVSFFLVSCEQNITSKEPKITISEEEWDFGKIKEDERPEHIFNIKNTGGSELVINRVRAACGCTATMLSSDHVLPGKSAELKTTFNPSGYEGKVKKAIYIESNDPESSKIKINIIAEVETIPAPKAYISNNQWDFELISHGDIPEFNFSIENKGELDLIIENIEASESIENNVDKPLIISPSEKKEITFTFDSTKHNIGEVRESIRIYCNDPRRKVFSLRVSGYIKEKEIPAVSISPTTTEFNLVSELDDDAVKRFIVQNTGDKSVKIISINTSADYLIPLNTEIEIAANEEKNLQLIFLKENYQNGDNGGSVEDFLYLTLAIPIKFIE